MVANGTRRPHLASSLVIAVVLTAGSLFAIAPQAAAEHVPPLTTINPCAEPLCDTAGAADLYVLKAGQFTGEGNAAGEAERQVEQITAAKTYGPLGTQRTLQIWDNGCTGSISQVAFIAVARPEAKYDIRFLQNRSEASGWTDFADNQLNEAGESVGDTILLFQAETSLDRIADGGRKDFTIGFTVVGNPAKDTAFTIRVDATAVDTGGTTQACASDFFHILIDDTQPGLVESGNLMPCTRDLDNNGHIDHVVVSFKEEMDMATFSLAHWTLGSGATQRSLIDYDHLTVINANYDPDAPTSTTYPQEDEADCGVLFTSAGAGHSLALDAEDGVAPTGAYTQVRFQFTESLDYDTGQAGKDLVIKYTGGAAFTDMAGKALRAPSGPASQPLDRAAPILYSVVPIDASSATTGFEKVRITFSEKLSQRPEPADLLFLGGAPASRLVTEVDQSTTTDIAIVTVTPPIQSCEIVQPWTCSGNVYTPVRVGAEVGTCPAKLPDEPDYDDTDDATKDCGKLIDVNSGNPIIVPDDGLLLRPVELPTVIYNLNGNNYPGAAEGQIGQVKVTLKFNVPVSDDAGATVPLVAADLDFIGSDEDGGPEAIINIQHKGGGDTAILTLDAPITPEDVDENPAIIRIEGRKICATGTGTASTCTYLPAQNVILRDLTSPAIQSAHSLDGNSDGIVDGLYLEFNEPIDDQSFCRFGGAPLLSCSKTELIVEDSASGSALEFNGPFTWDTDEFEDDNKGILKFQETTDNSATLRREVNTAVIPNLRTTVEGMFHDWARPLDGVQIGKGNPMETLDSLFATGRLKDGAPPRVLSASTQDTELDPADITKCKFGEPTVRVDEFCVEDPDGLIDAYRLVFSEKMKDDTFISTEWAVAGRTVQAKNARPEGIIGNRYGDIANDEVIVLPFTEAADLDGDTDDRPQVTYQATTGLQDLAGNMLQDIGLQEVNERDDARPVIVNVTGFVGDNKFTVTFSEGVDDGFKRGLTSPDFTYYNDASTAGAASFGGQDVVHQAGQAVATVFLNAALTAADIEKDMISARRDNPFEHTGHCDPATLDDATPACLGHSSDAIHETSLTVSFKLSVLGSQRRTLNFAPDVTPPAAVQNFAVTGGLVAADSLTLSWLAPGDDGDGNGPVTKYVVKVSKDAFTTFAGTADQMPPGVTATFEPNNPLAAPGLLQVMTLNGLEPGTPYYISVLAVDEAGKDGPAVIPLQATTLNDNTAPVYPNGGNLLPRLSGQAACLPNTRYLEDRPDFTWDAATDEDVSVVRYRYALTKDPTLEITASEANVTDQRTVTDVAVPAIGVWYFRVAAASGVMGPTSGCKYVHDYELINKDDIIEANLGLNDKDEAGGGVLVKRRGGDNIISWTLPPKEDLPGTLAGLRIWVYEDGAPRAIHNATGTYESLATGNYTDAEGDASDRYLVTMVFATNQEDDSPSTKDYDFVKVANVKKQLPTWLWILIGVCAALVIAGIIIYFVLRGKAAEQDAAGGLAYSWEETGAPAGTDPGSGLPTHDVKCPNCSTAFQAVGNMPLQITCPQCGTSGMLQ